MSLIFSSVTDPELPALIKGGAVGVIPTDTLYGLVAQAADPIAVKKLYSLKGREKKPGTLVAASIEQMEALGIKHRYLKAVEQFWPGPISIVLPCSEELAYLHLGLRSLAVRISADKQLNQLLITTGALLTTSANPPGEPPANNIEEAQKYFGENVDFYVNGGNLASRKPSTVIRIIDDAIEILREGAVKIDETGKIYK